MIFGFRQLGSPLALSLAAAFAPAQAANHLDTPAGEVSAQKFTYVVKSGDTLIRIVGQLLKSGVTWQHVRALNGLPDGDRIHPRQQIVLPLSWLKVVPFQAQVTATSGNARAAGKPLGKKSRLKDGDQIETGANGVVVVALPDGTTMRIAPESIVRINRLRLTRGRQSIEARLDLSKGNISVKAPPALTEREQAERGPTRDIEITTPKAVAAVRGTEFSISEGLVHSASSVTTGKINWRGKTNATQVKAGFGASADKQGKVSKPEALLKAPVLKLPAAALQEREATIRFGVVDGASGYRITVSANQAGTKEVSQYRIAANSLSFTSQRDGDYFVAVRPISASGIEGFSSLGKLTFAGRPFPPKPTSLKIRTDKNGQATLRWQAAPEVSKYRVQLASDAAFKAVQSDQQITATSLPFDVKSHGDMPLSWHWRVASVDKQGKSGRFAPMGSLIHEIAAPDIRVDTQLDIATLAWTPIKKARYRIAVTGRHGKTLIESVEKGLVYNIEDLPPGPYQATVTALFENGSESATAQPVPFDIPIVLRNSAGLPVQTSAGSIETESGW